MSCTSLLGGVFIVRSCSTENQRNLAEYLLCLHEWQAVLNYGFFFRYLSEVHARISHAISQCSPCYFMQRTTVEYGSVQAAWNQYTVLLVT